MNDHLTTIWFFLLATAAALSLVRRVRASRPLTSAAAGCCCKPLAGRVAKPSRPTRGDDSACPA